NVPRDLAKDFASEVVVRALQQLRASKEDGEDLPKISLAWLLQIGRHLIIDWVRRDTRRSAVHQILGDRLEADAPTQDQLEKYEEVLEYFNWLPDNEREILELVLISGLSPPEAGERMGLAKWAAYKAYARALEHLRDIIEQYGRVAKES